MCSRTTSTLCKKASQPCFDFQYLERHIPIVTAKAHSYAHRYDLPVIALRFVAAFGLGERWRDVICFGNGAEGVACVLRCASYRAYEALPV
jgi:hypothetical protein